MRTVIVLLLSAFILIGGCDSSKTVTPAKKPTPTAEPKVVIEAEPAPLKEVNEEENPDLYKNLIFNTKLGVSPKRPNWILFSHGTYIIFPKGTSPEDMRKSSLGLLQRYNNETMSIHKSPLVKGWIGRSPKGIYNYVSLDQVSSRMASDQELAAVSKENVQKDKENPIIVHINTPK